MLWPGAWVSVSLTLDFPKPESRAIMRLSLFRGLWLPAMAVTLLGLGACASPCARIDAEMRQLNADTIRDPNMAVDGRYLSHFQELAAQSVEHGCLAGQ